MKDYKISETEANRVLVKNYNDRPNALASYGQAKKTGEQTKDIFDRQFQLVKERHNKLADHMDEELERMQEKIDDAEKVAADAAQVAENAATEASSAAQVAGEAKSESSAAVATANSAKNESANANSKATSAKAMVDQLRAEADSGAFKGEKGDPFTVSKVYTSVAEMEADFDNDAVPEGAFVVIETGNVEDAENARLYIKGTDGFSFVTDLSGAKGMKGEPGKTPVNGVDYNTPTDKAAMVQAVLDALPTWEGGSY